MPTTAPGSTTPHDGDDALPTTMRAVARRRYGGPEQLRVESLPIPEIAADEVLVQVRAAGLDRGVWHLMTGLPYLVRVAGFGVRTPKEPVLGTDLAGRVVAVGDDVSGLSVGDDVFGVGVGTFAEFARAKADRVATLPTGMPHTAAGGVTVSGLTAMQALHDHGAIAAGQRVLVLGASGGVGSFAVQMARAAGAHVTGVASSAKQDRVRSLGADEVVAYDRGDSTLGRAPFDLIVDIGGRRSLRTLRRLLTPRGTLVIVGGEGGNRITGGVGRQVRATLLSPLVGQRLIAFIAKESGERLRRLRALLEDGAIAPEIDRAIPLDAVPDAIRDLAAGRITGKVIVEPSPRPIDNPAEKGLT